ncbi:MAG TPA: M15 family metallopeptidase [Acidimicrobiales bacterium]
MVAALGTFVPTRGDARPASPSSPASPGSPGSPASPAVPGQEDPSGSAEYSDTAIVDIPVEVAEGEPADVIGTLEEIEVNVSRQLADLHAADNAVRAAQAELEEATSVVAQTEAVIADLVADSDDVVTTAYVNPPGDAIFDTLTAGSANEAAVKQALLAIQAEEDAATLAELEAARRQLEEEKAAQAEIAAAAEQKRAEKEAQRADLQAATSQQTDFVLAVSEQLDKDLAEAEALRAVDPAMAEQLAQEQAALAAKLKEIADAQAFAEAVAFLEAEAARLQAEEERRRAEEERRAAEAAAAEAARQRATAGPPTGELATVTCPAGLGTITVDSGISAAVQDLLNDASAAGVNMCGGGWRSSDAQIELRKKNCGTTDYLIYEAPASECNPPTARPGTSMHERGLAIDFTCNGGGVIPSHSSPCFVWMDANAATYGLYNLPSEPWHWSTTGG